MVARQRGLPPSLRYKIWPLLLKYHPYVQDPYIQPDDEDDDDDDDNDNDNNDDGGEELPIKQIKFDLHKYLRNAERYKPKTQSPELKDLFEIQDKIFQTIESAILKFLKKWGSIVRYNSGLTWIALGLAEWIPPLENSQFVLCGKDDVAQNGTKLRNLNDDEFEKLEHGSEANFTSTTASTMDNTPLLSSSPKSVSSLDSLNLSSDNNNSANSNTEITVSSVKTLTFAEVYERLVLVIIHSPDPAIKNELKATSTNASNNSDSSDKEYTDDLPKFGGSIEDRISFFLYCLRKLLPELHRFLSDEDLLKGDWILWWLKYCGSKVWSRYDRGRVWDMLLGFRPNCIKFEKDLKQLRQINEETIRILGPDLFWNPLVENGASDSHGLSSTSSSYHGRSSSIKTLLNQVSFGSVEKTPTFASLSMKDGSPDEVIEPLVDLPFSQIDPHIQIIFISIAFLKAKEFTIMELDQSEIKQLLNKLSSLKTSEIRSFVGGNNSAKNNLINNSNDTNNSVTSSKNNSSLRLSNRDIENIIVESGELWRKFLYAQMIED
ncbi:hypothetical protein CANARDRAFT_182788, partial [[Candida] arabinofermentans NRRL YB-2248]